MTMSIKSIKSNAIDVGLAYNKKAILDIIIMAAFFAPSFVLVKLAVQEISPITVIALRVAIAGFLLWLVLKLKKIKIPSHINRLQLFKHCMILGFLLNGLPYVCFSFAATKIPTSLSALINGLTPVITVILANAFLDDEKLTWYKASGITLGIIGFLVLFLPTLQHSDLSFDPIGIVLAFIGTALYGVGAVYAKKHVHQVPPLVAPTIQLLSSLIYLVPCAFIFENPQTLFNTPIYAWSAVWVNALLTALAFIMYYKILAENGATVLSMATYLLPIFGTILGVIFLKETITVYFLCAAGLIFLGLLLTKTEGQKARG